METSKNLYGALYPECSFSITDQDIVETFVSLQENGHPEVTLLGAIEILRRHEEEIEYYNLYEMTPRQEHQMWAEMSRNKND